MMNLYKKERPIGRPYEIWKSFDGQWVWQVYRKRGTNAPGDVWYCGVESPLTSGVLEFGDVHKEVITSQAIRTYIDPKIDFFAGVRPELMGTNIALPDTDQSGTRMPPEVFPDLCSYFTENGMSYHVVDSRGDLRFFLSLELGQSRGIMQAKWDFSLSQNEGELNYISKRAVNLSQNAKDQLATAIRDELNRA